MITTEKEHKRFFCHMMKPNYGKEVLIQDSSLSRQWIELGWITVASHKPFQQSEPYFMVVKLTDKGQAIIDFENL